MKASRGDGLIDIPSNHSVDETVEKLKGVLQAKGVTLFALVDHSGEAERVGMKMRPTKLLIFGNPQGGTPVMLAAPSIAIDLPLKMPMEKSGFPTTVRHTCRSGMVYRRSCCRTSQWWRRWQRRRRSSFCHNARVRRVKE